jgi:hypothetical protein
MAWESGMDKRYAIGLLTTMLLAAPGCAGDDDDAPRGTAVAHVAEFPKVLTAGGPVLTHALIVPIFFAGDDQQASATTFFDAVGGSGYWHDAAAEYGVGAATAQAPVVLSTAAPATISDDEIKAMLVAMLDGSNAQLGAPNPAAIYTFVLPKGTTVMAQGLIGCQQFTANHDEVAVGQSHVALAYIPRCGDTFDTVATSHELMEAATDPFLYSNPAWSTVDNRFAFWKGVVNLGDLVEINDLCSTKSGDLAVIDPQAGPVERAWSNASLAAGHDPCVPLPPGRAYFNAVAQLDDDIAVQFPTARAPEMARGVRVPMGQSRTITVTLFSDSPVDPWTVQAVDLGALVGNPPQLSFALDKTTGGAGDRLQLTITRIAASAPFAGMGGGTPFAIVSSLDPSATQLGSPKQQLYVAYAGE